MISGQFPAASEKSVILSQKSDGFLDVEITIVVCREIAAIFIFAVLLLQQHNIPHPIAGLRFLWLNGQVPEARAQPAKRPAVCREGELDKFRTYHAPPCAHDPVNLDRARARAAFKHDIREVRIIPHEFQVFIRVKDRQGSEACAVCMAGTVGIGGAGRGRAQACPGWERISRIPAIKPCVWRIWWRRDGFTVIRAWLDCPFWPCKLDWPESQGWHCP